MNAFLDITIHQKNYAQRQVLRNLRVAVDQAEVVSLIGASGCGKSTLLSIVAGLDREFRGTVRLDGQVLDGVSRDVGFIFQEPRLFPWLSVAQNVAFSLGPGSDKHPLVATLLDEVGLAGYANALPKQLSGGQAQRVAIARGLFTRPRVLLLDEPFSAVDAFTRIRLQDLLSRVVRQHGLTVLLVTHEIDEALFLSDRVILLDTVAGPVRAEFSVDLPQPRERAAAALSPLKATILNHLQAAHAF